MTEAERALMYALARAVMVLIKSITDIALDRGDYRYRVEKLPEFNSELESAYWKCRRE